MASQSQRTQIKVNKVFCFSSQAWNKSEHARHKCQEESKAIFLPLLFLVSSVAVSFWQRLAASCGKSQRLLVNCVYEWVAVRELEEEPPTAAEFGP